MLNIGVSVVTPRAMEGMAFSQYSSNEGECLASAHSNSLVYFVNRDHHFNHQERNNQSLIMDNSSNYDPFY